MECFPSFSSPAPDPLAFLQKRVKKRESGAATYFALLPPRLDADNLLPTCQRFKLPRRTRRFSGAPQQEGQATGFCSRGGATGNSQVDSSVCKSGSATDSHWACGQTNGLCLSRLQNSWSNVEGNPVYTPRLQPLPSMYPPPEDVWAKWRSERENALIQKRSACSGHTATVCQKYLAEPTRGVQTPKPQDPRGHLTFLPAKGAPPFRNFPFDESNVNNRACETHFHEHSTRAFGDTEELCRPRRGHRMAREFSRKWLENGLSVRLSSLGKQLCRRSVGCGVEAGRPVEGESSSDGNSSLLTGKCRELSESTGQDPSEMFTHTSALTSSSSGLAYAEDPPVARQSLPPPHPPQSKERAEALLALSTTNGRVFSDFPVSSPSVLAPCGAHAREKPFRDKAFWAAAGSVSCPGWNACSARVSSFLSNPRTAVSAHVERFQARAENDVSLFSDHEGENHRPPSSAARIRTATIWEAHKQRALLTRQEVEPLQFSLKKDSGEVARVSTSCGESHQPALERFLPNGEATEPPKALKVDRRDRNVWESLASWYKMRYEKMEVHEPFYSSHRASEFATRDAEDAESEREENNFLPQTWADFVREPTPSHSPCRVTEASVGHSAFRPPASPRSSALKRTEAEARSRAFLPSSRRIRNSGEARGADKGGDTPEGMRGESVEVGASSAFRGLSREAAHDPVAYEKQQTKVRGKREETGFPVDERQDNGGRRSRHKDNRGSSVTPPSSRSVSESRSAWRRRRRTLRHSLQQQRETCIAEDSIIIELGEKISLPELQRVMEKVQRKAGELGRRYQDATVLDRFALSAENCGISLYRDSPHSHLVPGYWRQKAGDTPASQSPHCRAAASPSPVHLQLYGCVSPRPPSSCVVLSSSTCLTPRSVSAPPTASSFRYASFLHSTAAMSPLTQHSLPLAFAKPRLSSPPVNAPYRWRSGSSVHAPSVQKRRLLAYVGPVTFSSPWKSHFEKKSGSGIGEKKIEKPVTGQGAVQLDHFFRLRSLRLPVDTAEQILRSPEETCDSWASLSMHIPLCLHSNPKDIFIRSKKRWRTSLAQGDMNGNREEIHKFRNGIRVEKGEESHAEENLVHRHQPNEKVYRVRIEPEDSDEDRTRMELNLRSFSHALRELAGELPSPKTSVSRGEKPHAEKGGQEEEDEQRESSSATRNEAVAGRKDYSDEANSACDGPNSKALLRIKPTSHMRPETQTRTSQESWILRYGFRGAMSLDQTRQNHFHHLVEPVRTEQRGHSWRQRVAVASPLSGARRLEVSGILGALRSPCAFEGRLSPNTEVSSRSSPCRTCLEGTKQDLSGRAMGTQLATSTRTESFRRRAESRRDKREDEETCGEREETDAWVENEKDKGKMRGFGAGDNRDQGRQNLAGSGEEEGTGGEETRRDRRRDVSICRSNASHAKTYLQAMTSDFLLLSSYESLSSCLSTCDCAPSTAGDIGAQTPGKNRVTSRGDGGAAVLDSLDWPVGSEEVACTRGDGRQRKEGTENKSRGEPGEREGDEAEGDGESMSVLLGERQRHCASERSDASASPEKKRRLLPLPAFLR